LEAISLPTNFGRGRREPCRQVLEAVPGGVRLARGEAGDVHARRAEAGAAREAGVVHLGPQAFRGVAGADEDPACAGEALGGERAEARVGLDDVLQRAAVDLDGVRDVPEPAGEDRGAHDEVVGERDLGAGAGGGLADGGDVGLDVAVELLVGQVRKGAGVGALVAIGDVERQQPADVRPVDRCARRRAAHVNLELAVVPLTGGVDPVELERVAVLAEEVELVPRADEGGGELRVVDVGAGAVQEVAVEDEDAHVRRRRVRPGAAEAAARVPANV
jgi:hypothetical protein